MFDSLLADRRTRDRRFTVYRSDERTDVEAWLADHDVPVESRSLPSGGPDPFVEIEADGEFVGVLGLAALEGLLEPPINRPGEEAAVSEGYRVIFDVFVDTAFTGLARRNLLAVSREIEDRAYRVGTGTLRVSFQTLSTFQSQAEVYRALATATDLDVHVYGAPDWTPPEISGVTYHADETEPVERHWVLAFDGGTEETQACGLVARERSTGYDSFWTDDPDTVTEISAALTADRPT